MARKASADSDSSRGLGDVIGVALLGLLMPRATTLRIFVGGAVTAVVFTALELSDVAGAMFGTVVSFAGAPLGIHGVAQTRDLTDLWALALIPVGCWYGLHRLQRQTQTQMENT